MRDFRICAWTQSFGACLFVSVTQILLFPTYQYPEQWVCALESMSNTQANMVPVHLGSRWAGEVGVKRGGQNPN